MGRPKGSLTKNKKKEYTKNINIGKGSLSGDTYANWMTEGIKYIKELKKEKKYPDGIKLNPKWDEYFTSREKKKVLKYIAKTGNLQYNIVKLKEVIHGTK